MEHKRNLRPGTMLYPLPAVIVTCGTEGKNNMLTVSWTGTICSDPAMCYISVRPSRFSYPMIKERMEFTINLTTEQMAAATDWAGVRSGADYDKWKETGLTPVPGVKVACPSIAESPVNIECRVKRSSALALTTCLSPKCLMSELTNRFLTLKPMRSGLTWRISSIITTEVIIPKERKSASSAFLSRRKRNKF